MVNYKKIVEELRGFEEVGELSLFAVVKMDEFIDKWSVIFAAKDLKDKNSDTIYKKINELITRYSSSEDRPEISRIGLFSSSHYLVHGILKYGKEDLANLKINGNTIHSGSMFFPEKNTETKI